MGTYWDPHNWYIETKKRPTLDVVNVDFAFVSELECALSVFLTECVGFVDFDGVREFAIPK
jgi:hypothetical protein